MLSASFTKPRIDSISATVNGDVETLEVKESTNIQRTKVSQRQITYRYRCSVEPRATPAARSVEIHASGGQ